MDETQNSGCECGKNLSAHTDTGYQFMTMVSSTPAQTFVSAKFSRRPNVEPMVHRKGLATRLVKGNCPGTIHRTIARLAQNSIPRYLYSSGKRAEGGSGIRPLRFDLYVQWALQLTETAGIVI
jgi:hypothetical protein